MCQHGCVLIRTDANGEISYGHVMRCLSVAVALRGLGREPVFVLSDGNAAELLRERGYDAHVLSSDWRNLVDGVEGLRDLCRRNRPAMLVDSYSATREFVEVATEFAEVCYLGSKGDDLGPLRLLTNYSTTIDCAFYEATYGPRGTKLLLGPAYAPLRPEFRRDPIPRATHVKRVLLTTGNTDSSGFVPAFLESALKCHELAGIEFDVVVGRAFEDVVGIRSEFGGEQRVVLHENVDAMWNLMANCDVAVSANGTTVYELAAIGVPAVTFSMVPEQDASADGMAALGMVDFAGRLHEDGAAVVNSAVESLATLCADSVRRHRLAERAHAVVDGLGAEKIARELCTIADGAQR